MVKRTSLTIISLIAFLIIHFISLNAYAQETELTSGAISGIKVTDPTNTGSASTTIPIEVPPGRKGVAPNIVINYNSNKSNGWVGVGWDLNLGEIQRSTKKGVKYNTNDYIFLGNGSSSEMVSRPDWGTNYYGAKIEGAFNKFYYNSSTGGWEVTDKTGTKYYYGTASSSRQDNTYGTFRWYLDRVEDTNGNYITVSYLKDQGEVYIDRIDYTGNTAGLNPTNYVKFYWESRTDIVSLYTTNSLVRTAYRLKTIDINASGQKSKAYALTYTQSSGTSRSLLTSVQMYGNNATLDANGTVTSGSALPATQFTYSSDSQSFTTLGEWVGAFGDAESSRYYYADFNGDGKTDVAFLSAQGAFSVALSTGSVFTAPTPWISGFGDGSPSRYRFGDFNGDFKTDVAYIASQSTIYIALSTGSGFATVTLWGSLGDGDPSRYFFGDFNSDDKIDVAFLSGQASFSVALSTGTGFASSMPWIGSFGDGGPGRYFLGDFNGDGKTDVTFLSAQGGFTIAVSTGSQFTVAGSIGGFGDGSSPASYYFGDLNGDGKTDIAFLSAQASFSVVLATGSGFESPVAWIGSFGDANLSNYRFADFNGDGKTDIAFISSSTQGGAVHVGLSNGSGFATPAQWVGSYGSGQAAYYRVGDFNGDGKYDFSFLASQASLHVSLAGTPEIITDMLNVVNNGIGGTTTIAYKPSSAYANTFLPFIVQTTSSITNNDANGNIGTSNFTYSGGYFNSQEREFRGFSYQKSTNPVNTTTETWFYQDDIYNGLPYEQITKDVYGNTYTRTYNTYTSTSPYTGVNFPYVAQKDNYVYDGAQNYRQTTTSFEYDSYGNVTRKYSWGDVSVSGDEKDEIAIYVYDTGKWMVSLPSHTYITDSNGIVKSQTLFSYDSKGNLRTKTNWLSGGASSVTSYTYDVYGNQKTITDPKSNITTISYDSTYTYPTATINSLGHISQASYDLRIGKPLLKTDPNGNTTTFEYDVFGRLLESTDPGTSPSVYKWKEAYFDGLGRTIKTRTPGPDNKIIVTQITYNNIGLVSAKSFPYFEGIETPRWAYYTYDPIGRTTQVTNPDGTTVRNSYMQGRTTTIDANNHVKIEEKDIYGRLVKVEEYTGTYPSVSLYATTTYEYDILGNLLKTTDTKGNQTTIVYDTLGRKTAMTDPDMGHWQYTYDANGNLTSQTDAKGQTITFTYDALNRITRKHYPTGPDVVYTYDETTSTNPIGKLTTVTDATGQEKYYYDELGRTTKLIKTIDGIQYITENIYDSLGRITSTKYPDTETVNYGYDAAGNLTQVSGYVTYSNFNAMGQAGLITYANGVTTQYQYNTNNNRLYSITTNSPISGGLQNLSYVYDNTGNVTTITDIMDNTRTQNFNYDDINRLTQAQSTTYGTLTYNYDQIGNMAYNSQVGTYTYGTKPHAVIQAGANTYIYDANGNMTGGAGRTIAYDYDNKPSTITYNSVTANFTYDYSGDRIKKIAGSTATLYVGTIYECTNSECTKYIFAGKNMVASKAASNTLYYHKDHLGSSSIITDASGTKAEEIYYYPYGGTRQDTGSVNVKHKYTGQEEDQETALYYYGARYYDPALARFISADTIVPKPEDPQSLNRYSYVKNNPLIYVDPTGMEDEEYEEYNGNYTTDSCVVNGAMAIANWLESGWNWMQSTWNSATNIYNQTVTGLAAMLTYDFNEARRGAIKKLEQDGLINEEARKTVGGFEEEEQKDTEKGIKFLAENTAFWLVGKTRLVGKIGVGKGGETSENLYSFTTSAGKHLDEVILKGEYAGQFTRPFMRSPLTVQTIMATGKGIPDATFKGGMNWTVPGTFRGSQGIWELGINSETNVIYHFNFKSIK